MNSIIYISDAYSDEFPSNSNGAFTCNINDNTEWGGHMFVMFCYVTIKCSPVCWAGTPASVQSHL